MSPARHKDADQGPAARAKGLVHRVDETQQRWPWLAVAVATWKKFSDDQAGNLAALIAYYAFASIFPLLLVAVTILDIVASHSPKVGAQLLAALQTYPVVGMQLQSTMTHGLSGTGLALSHRHPADPFRRTWRGHRDPERTELGLGGTAVPASAFPQELAAQPRFDRRARAWPDHYDRAVERGRRNRSPRRRVRQDCRVRCLAAAEHRPVLGRLPARDRGRGPDARPAAQRDTCGNRVAAAAASRRLLHRSPRQEQRGLRHVRGRARTARLVLPAGADHLVRR